VNISQTLTEGYIVTNSSSGQIGLPEAPPTPLLPGRHGHPCRRVRLYAACHVELRRAGHTAIAELWPASGLSAPPPLAWMAEQPVLGLQESRIPAGHACLSASPRRRPSQPSGCHRRGVRCQIDTVASPDADPIHSGQILEGGLSQTKEAKTVNNSKF
jgi:hypothetical protein